MIAPTFANDLDRRRRANKLSIAALSGLADVSYGHVFHGTTGGGRISPDEAAGLARRSDERRRRTRRAGRSLARYPVARLSGQHRLDDRRNYGRRVLVTLQSLRADTDACQLQTGDLHPDPAWRPRADRAPSRPGFDLGDGGDKDGPPYDRGGRYGDLLPAKALEDATSAP